MKNNEKLEDELHNIKTIIFDRKGNMIKGDFSIKDIIDLIEQRNDYKAFASYDILIEKPANKISVVFSTNTISDSFKVEDFKQCLQAETFARLPSLILLLPEYIQ